MIGEYCRETIDIDDVEYEEVDLEKQRLFGEERDEDKKGNKQE